MRDSEAGGLQQWRREHRLLDAVVEGLTSGFIFGLFLGLLDGLSRGITGGLLCGTVAAVIRFMVPFTSRRHERTNRALVVILLLSLPYLAAIVAFLWL